MANKTAFHGNAYFPLQYPKAAQFFISNIVHTNLKASDPLQRGCDCVTLQLHGEPYC